MKIKHIITILLSWPKKYTVTFLIIIVVIGGYFYFQKNKTPQYDFVIAEKGNLKQEVSVTGKVKSASRVDLAFETSGRVDNIIVDVGDKVYEGQKLTYLNASQYLAQYNQAKANLEAEKSKLDQLKAGTRPEEINIQKIKVVNAEQSLLDAKNNLLIKVKDSFTKSDSAIRNNVDQLFINTRSSNPQLNFVTGSVLKIELESKRFAIESILNNWEQNVSSDENILNNLIKQSADAKNNLNEISSFLDKIAFAVNDLKANYSLSQTTIDGYKADIEASRNSINTVLVNLASSDEKLRTSESTLMLAKQELILKESGSTNEQIKIQEAVINSAEANLRNFESMIAKTIIYSPISGIITKKNIEKGEIAQPNSPVLTIIGDTVFEIEAFVPEADVSKISIGDISSVTLDAYEDDVIFKAKIVFIDPAETIVDGVSTYKTKFRFVEKDKRIKSGMTANIDILTDMRENVVSVSTRAIHTKNDGTDYVEVLKNNEIIEVVVKTGMRSTEGLTEIISGVEEGEEIIMFRE